MGLGAFYHWIHRLIDSWLIGLFLVRLGPPLVGGSEDARFLAARPTRLRRLRSRPGGGRFGI